MSVWNKDRFGQMIKATKTRLATGAAWSRQWAGVQAVRVQNRVSHVPRKVLWGIGALLAALLAIIIFLAQPNWNWFRPTLSSIVSDRLNRPVEITGDLRVKLFSFTPEARVGGLKIGQPNWAKSAVKTAHMAEAQQFNISTELMPLFIGRVVLPHVEITKPVVTLFQDKGGRANWNFSTGAKSAEAFKLPPIKTFIIRDGQISYNSVSLGLNFKGTVSAQESAGAGRKYAFNFDGDGRLNGQVFDMAATGGPLLNVRTDKPYPFDLTVRAGPTRLTAKGRVLKPFNLGQLDGDVSVTGRSLAELYEITGLTLPNTPAYKITAHVNRNERVYHINRINGRVGGSDVAGDLKVNLNNEGRPYLTGDISSKMLDFQDLGSLFGATAANRPDAPELSAAPEEAAVTARRLLPDVPLDVARVRGMDAKVNYKALSVKTRPNWPLRQVNLGIVLDKGRLTLNPVEFNFPHGRLTGMADIDARTDVQTNHIDMRLTGLRIQDFTPSIGGAEPVEGLLDARIRATGTGHTVHDAASSANGDFALVMPQGTIRQSFAELMGVNATKGLFMLISKDPKETPVRCAIAGFKITDGVMRAQNIVFDTEVVRVSGSGRINLKDESLDLVFEGKPKTFRLVRVDVPIVIGGNLTQPKIGLDAKTAIAQGGLAAAFNTVLPFVNLDYAGDANCAALEAQTHSRVRN
ncbi:AsmA family protein [Asticcacaulis sp. SL142]|uniref:AsmA family protein n=1 Tax=Asticcacaulis sp. SL142 TaxID=2995155 RepID=UPI00226D168A|nr:AsmA family protein [Asticcacaulis sp. SL142]WAC48387.1 AsmA family protein [Asticcacaulis sp. SL142]